MLALKTTRIAVVVAVVGLSAAYAQPGYVSRVVYERPAPQSVVPTEEVAQLIADLSNDSLEVRRAARRALQAMGPRIRPELQWALENHRGSLPDVDLVRAGLGYAIAELIALIDHCDEQLRSAPSLVTLRYTDAALTTVLSDFGRQVDARVLVRSDDLDRNLEWLDVRRATLNVEQVSFWDALRALRQHLNLDSAAGRDAVTLNLRLDSTAGHPRRSYLDESNAVVSGPLLTATTLSEQRGGYITLNVRAVAEPKVGAGEYAVLTVEDYTDDRGQSLLKEGDRRSFPSTGGYVFEKSEVDLLWHWTIPVQLPAPPVGRTIGTLQGTLGVAAGPPELNLTIADLSRPSSQSFDWDGIVVTVNVSYQAGTQYVVSGDLSAPTDSPMSRAIAEANSSGWALENARNRLERFGLRDASGNVVRREVVLGATRREAGRDIIEWTLYTIDSSRLSTAHRQQPGVCNAMCVPVALTWTVPAETRWFMVPFELRASPAGRSPTL